VQNEPTEKCKNQQHMIGQKECHHPEKENWLQWKSSHLS